jgi:hypothetical protein
MKHASEQYLIDFTSRTNDRCAKVAGLRELQLGISPGRLNGVVELLQRLTVLSRYLPEDLNESYTVEAQVSAIASRIHARHSVSEKTVRNWTADAIQLGCLAVDYRSQKFGGRSWNMYSINFAKVLELLRVAGSGRKWPETVTAPRAETISDPGAETVTDPNSVLTKSFNTTADAREQQQNLQTLSHDRLVGECSYDRLVDEYYALEVHRADELLGRAVRKVGCEYLERLLRYYQSQPGAWGPGALRCRVQAAQPGLPIEKGWPPPRIKPAEPVLVPVKHVDTKLEEGLRHTRVFKLLRSQLGRVPEDHEVEEALRSQI